jgi:beta-alanine degradation protein BauB
MIASRMFLFAILFAVAALLASDVLDAQSRIAMDNEFVRVIDATEMPHVKSPRHRHQFNRVMVYLNGGDMEITFDDGHKDGQHWKPGDVAWSLSEGYHVSENVGSSPIHLLEIELKQPAPMVAPVRKPELDPLVNDPKHYSLLFENDQVRVFRSWREPGGVEPLHQHVGRGRVTIFLTDTDSKVQLEDGATSTLHANAGDARWSAGPVTHTSTNTGANRLEVVVVEVK